MVDGCAKIAPTGNAFRPAANSLLPHLQAVLRISTTAATLVLILYRGIPITPWY
jgi:hypothetical protein